MQISLNYFYFLFSAFVCPTENSNYAALKNTCYYFDTNYLTPEDARSACDSKFGNLKGQLVEPRSIEENADIYAKAEEVQATLYGWWIGVNDSQNEGTFRYESNGDVVPFTVCWGLS